MTGMFFCFRKIETLLFFFPCPSLHPSSPSSRPVRDHSFPVTRAAFLSVLEGSTAARALLRNSSTPPPLVHYNNEKTRERIMSLGQNRTWQLQRDPAAHILNCAVVASRIQLACRVHSFLHRQLKPSSSPLPLPPLFSFSASFFICRCQNRRLLLLLLLLLAVRAGLHSAALAHCVTPRTERLPSPLPLTRWQGEATSSMTGLPSSTNSENKLSTVQTT